NAWRLAKSRWITNGATAANDHMMVMKCECPPESSMNKSATVIATTASTDSAAQNASACPARALIEFGERSWCSVYGSEMNASWALVSHISTDAASA